jgi:anti-anti-sigma factor
MVIATIARSTERSSAGTGTGPAMAVVAVDGDIDRDTAPLLAEALTASIDDQPRTCLDMRDVAVLDAAGARVLLGARRYADDHGRGFCVRGVHGMPERVLTILGLDRLVTGSNRSIATPIEGDRAVSPTVAGEPDRALRDHLVALACRADGTQQIAADLVRIAVLSADRVGGVSYASVTGREAGAYTTVAASSILAVEIDRAQYADQAGPCLEALDAGYPAVVPDIAATMTWPGFREVATRLGLQASLSIPLFAGRGTTVGALNLYSHEPSALKVLSTAVWAVYEGDTTPDPRADDLDAGGNELVTGLTGAFAAQATIQQAVGLLIATTGRTRDEAFDELRLKAGAAGETLLDVAGRMLAEHSA